jgi:hypothetical protein
MNSNYVNKVKSAMTYVPNDAASRPEDSWQGIVPFSRYQPLVLCDLRTTNGFTRVFQFIRHLYMNYQTYDCTPERYIQYSITTGTHTSFYRYTRNSTQPINGYSETPCIWGTNPRVNPRHYNETIGGEITYPMNFNDGGIDQSLYKLDVLGQADSTDMIQCPDSNQFLKLANNPTGVVGIATSAGPWSCAQCVPACRSDQYCQTDPSTGHQTGICICKGQYSHWNATLGSCVMDFCEYGKYGIYCENQCQKCPENTSCDDDVYGTGLCECPGGGRPNPFTLQCEAQDCGPLNACSNNGICIQTG